VDVPQPENLLGELVDVVERVNQISSSLLSDTREVLAHINAQEKVIEEASTTAKFVPIDRDPGCRRPILTDEADKVYVIRQSPFQPKLGRYPRNPDIHPSKQCHFSSAWFNTYPHVEYLVKKDAAFCFVCQLFPSGIGTKQAQGCKAWAEDGVKLSTRSKVAERTSQEN
jgi:hypothetical protein